MENIIIAKFIGKNKDLGFETGKNYTLSTWIDNNFIWIKDDREQQVPYANVKTFAQNWFIFILN